MPIPQIKTQKRTDDTVVDEWRYSQLKHLVGSLLQSIRGGENLNPVEQLCSQLIKKKHRISQTYKVLMQMEGLGLPPFIEKWQKEQQISKILWAIYSFTADKHNGIKLARWYMTPDKVQKCQPRKSQLCWKGCGQKGKCPTYGGSVQS